jgi:hypothetical protein
MLLAMVIHTASAAPGLTTSRRHVVEHGGCTSSLSLPRASCRSHDSWYDRSSDAAAPATSATSLCSLRTSTRTHVRR